MPDPDMEFEEAPPPAPKPAPPRKPELPRWAKPETRALPQSSVFAGRAPPYSVEAEEYLLSCCLLDGSDTIAKCLEKNLKPAAFYVPANQLIYEKLCALYRKQPPVELAMVIEELRTEKQLEAVGGVPYLLQISGRIPTTAQAVYFIEKVYELYQLRELIKVSTGIVEQCYGYQGDGPEFFANARASFDAALNGAAPKRQRGRSLFEFDLPRDGDRSILLGNRYLNRGDGAVLAGSSGIGKSAMAIQSATLWAIAEPFAGIRPNGELRSLVIQSEDSDGDIAELRLSIEHSLKLTPRQRETVGANLRILTNRVDRGDRFIAWLKREIEDFHPDLVWLNPLQAFMEGDITESQDLGKFLREGLNGLTGEPPAFGIIVIHHTTKPAVGKDRQERLWHEVMYDMAGGAEIINWARAILSLRATDQEGNFNLVLAKRGRRAGVTRMVEQGAGYREETITTVPLRWSREHLTNLPGRKLPMPVLFWEPREPDPEKPKEGGWRLPDFDPIRRFLPPPEADPIEIHVLYRLAKSSVSMSNLRFHRAIDQLVTAGLVEKVVGEQPNQPDRYRAARGRSPEEGP